MGTERGVLHMAKSLEFCSCHIRDPFVHTEEPKDIGIVGHGRLTVSSQAGIDLHHIRTQCEGFPS